MVLLHKLYNTPFVQKTHSQDLWQRATARWAEIGAISPDLAPAVALQQRLVRLILDAADRLSQALPSTLTPASVEDKWRRSLPALRNEYVPIPDSLKETLPSFCGALAEAGAGDSALHIRDALLHGHIDRGSLLSVSLARNQKAIRTSALHMGFSPDLVWLIGELASSPLAHHLQTQLMGLLGSDPRTGTGVRPQDGWDRGYCPFCGSWPAFIESQGGSHALRCSFCALAWTLSALRCIYCGNAGDDFVSAAPDVNRPQRRVQLCAACGCYTKVIEVAEATPFPLIAIEDLSTMDLDRGAMGRDYRRPSLQDLDAIEPLKSSC
ncbi:MAG: formate dehydrogenase accessory protein FdhE [Acidobacteria bacterium]|nr:formate dehydrogenase accessory protein FdhE [Acidobacteriota bacterium]